MNRFYITTPIYYVNDKPHLGHAYSTTIADILARYHRLFGDETKMMTGTDEHGQKVQQSAESRGKTPQAHCDEFSEVFKVAWKNMNIQYDFFFRTTADFHKRAVQSALQELWDKKEIYSNTYEGWYCVSEEIFYTEKELVNGKTPDGKEVVKVKEKNYFFKMSGYQNKLIEYIEKNPRFIQPENRRNEVLGFLRQPLTDLCISRPKARLTWGIEIPFDSEYVTYVWFDALLNYAVGVGYGQSDRLKEFNSWWQEAGAHHILGKDILITHAVYWPTMLMALGLNLPKTIFAHGWILNKENEKMSKSRGSIMDPNELIKVFGLEPLRYFLFREVIFGNDAPVSYDLIAGCVNNDLANNIGNLLSRTTNLIDKYFAGKAPRQLTPDERDRRLSDLALTTPELVRECILNFQTAQAVQHIVDLLNAANKYLEDKAPWKLAKTDLAGAGSCLYTSLEVLRIAGGLLAPIMPEKMKSLLSIIGVNESPAVVGADASPQWQNLKKWGIIAENTSVQKATPLFPRIELPPI